eukprot:452560_1
MAAAFFCLICILCTVNCHMKLVYPPPRSTSAGIKTGPCGDQTFSEGSVTNLEANSIVTIEIIETIHHVGAPYRIALSNILNDTYTDCILLNHIPQHTHSTKATLLIDIKIPNVNCTMCALQVVSVMTDKIGQGNTCEYKSDGKSGSCYSNYHSCANIIINGVTNRDELICEQPTNWPYKQLTWNMYTQESSDQYWCEISSNPLQLKLIINDSNSCPTMGPTSMPSSAPSGIITTGMPSITSVSPTVSTDTTKETEVYSSLLSNTQSTITDIGTNGSFIVGCLVKNLIIVLICVMITI